MEQIKVNVCMGTTCFVMGGSNLQELYDIIPQKYGEKVKIIGRPCLKLCSDNGEYSKAPYVKIDEDVIEEATIEKVLDLVDKKLGSV